MLSRSLIAQRINFNIFYGVSFMLKQNSMIDLGKPVSYVYEKKDQGVLKCLIRVAERMHADEVSFMYEAPRVEDGWCQQPKSSWWSVKNVDGESANTAIPFEDSGKRLYYFPCFKALGEEKAKYVYPDAAKEITYPMFFTASPYPQVRPNLSSSKF